MPKITESAVEDTAITWFEELGYDYAYGPDITGEGLERESHKQVVLEDRLLGALKRINPGLPASALKKAAALLGEFDNPDLIQSNKGFHRLITDGVRVSYTEAGHQKDTIVRVVDFDHASHNDWLVVNQYTVQGPKHTCRPDMVVFLNGLPLVVFELKNPADENADVWMAYDQIQNYKTDIKALFHHNAFCVISDFTSARFGSLTSNKERYLGWRTIDGETIDPLGPHQELETLVRGLFDQALFLKYIRNFILFEDEGRLVKKVAGYHQFHAVRAVAQSVVCAAAPGGSRKGGVVWHTQGAGKSIEMVCAASVLLVEAFSVFLDKVDIIRGLLHGCDYTEFRTQALKLLPKVVDHVLQQTSEDKKKDGRKLFCDHVLAASQAFALCGTLDEAAPYKEELAFFQAVKGVLSKGDPSHALKSEEKEHAMRQIVSSALASDGVMDIFEVAGLKNPDISILSDEFLADVRKLEYKNLAVEVLERLLQDQIKSRFKTNVVTREKFSTMLGAVLNRYKARAVETAQLIEELIEMAKEFNAAVNRGVELGLNRDELAFYDALAADEASVRDLGDEILKKIAHELTVSLKASASVDWSKRESVRAAMRMRIKLILSKFKYPPSKSNEATELVLKQAEVLADEWAR